MDTGFTTKVNAPARAAASAARWDEVLAPSKSPVSIASAIKPMSTNNNTATVTSMYPPSLTLRTIIINLVYPTPIPLLKQERWLRHGADGVVIETIFGCLKLLAATRCSNHFRIQKIKVRLAPKWSRSHHIADISLLLISVSSSKRNCRDFDGTVKRTLAVIHARRIGGFDHFGEHGCAFRSGTKHT